MKKYLKFFGNLSAVSQSITIKRNNGDLDAGTTRQNYFSATKIICAEQTEIIQELQWYPHLSYQAIYVTVKSAPGSTGL